MSAWHARMAQLEAKVRSLPNGTFICTCAIVFGEAEAGHAINPGQHPHIRDHFEKWFNEKFLAHCVHITPATRIAYAEIISKLLKKNPRPPGTKIKTERHLLNTYGVDINDVWIAAAAREHKLTLVTHDAIEKIRDAVPDLDVECWI